MTRAHFKRGAAAIYAAATKTRCIGYDSGLLPIRRVEGVTVISVGNLRAGGSGKTPLAMYLAEQIRDEQIPVALLLRGYRGRLSASGGVVSRGNGPEVAPDQAGDEATLAAIRLRGVEVRVGANRQRQVEGARDNGARVIILDDGFQHRRLHRDLDILLVCPEDLAPSTALLPLGPLREHATAKTRATIVGGLAADWQGIEPRPQFLLDYVPLGLIHKSPDLSPIEHWAGRAALLVAGIARSDCFTETARRAGLTVAGTRYFPDHHPFSASDIKAIIAEAQSQKAKLVVTTEKDLVRLGRWNAPIPLMALRIDIEVSHGLSLLQRSLFDKIRPVQQ